MPMVREVERNTGSLTQEMSADGGYFSTKAVAALGALGVVILNRRPLLGASFIAWWRRGTMSRECPPFGAHLLHKGRDSSRFNDGFQKFLIRPDVRLS